MTDNFFSESLGYLLRSLPNSSKLRCLDITSREVDFSEVFGSLKPKIYQQLIDLRIGPNKVDYDTFTRTITHITSKSFEKLPLRRIVLSGTCIPPPALSELTCLTPQLRMLTLNRCDLDVSEVKLSERESRVVMTSDGENICPNIDHWIAFTCLTTNQPSSGDDDSLSDLWSLYLVDDLQRSTPNRKSRLQAIVSGLNLFSHNFFEFYSAFKDKAGDIIKCLPKCPCLQHIALGHKGRPLGTGILKKLSEALLNPDCTVEKVTLGTLGSNKEMCEFLKCLANHGTKLAYLDIADCTLKDEDSKYILRLIQCSDSRIPFTLKFNDSNFSDHTWTVLKDLAKSKHFSINQCNKPVITLQKREGEVKALLEVSKFNDAIITPSPKLCDADLELTRLAIQLQRQMPTENVEKLEPHYPKIHQAKIALDECSKLPSMQVDLLDAALDSEACNRAVEQAMSNIKAAIQKALQAFQEESCQRLKDVVNAKSLQSFVSIAKFTPSTSDSSLEPLSRLLDRQVENSIRSMMLDANVKIAEEMLCRMTTGLKGDIEDCLNGFPDRHTLKPSKSVASADSEYASG
ncbi:unnamed protein product [Hydatigera taeniaeformis]|uniref:CARMIL_C domain-containing protein n=1 Tax=Hydatigena taeniaeformis TaxID=6205 RepID=A0A0R3X0K0_HYDTA|nr:unnamed protein product [Hydatigera taeniaeformis]